jgi:hypothetical protein
MFRTGGQIIVLDAARRTITVGVVRDGETVVTELPLRSGEVVAISHQRSHEPELRLELVGLRPIVLGTFTTQEVALRLARAIARLTRWALSFDVDESVPLGIRTVESDEEDTLTAPPPGSRGYRPARANSVRAVRGVSAGRRGLA